MWTYQPPINDIKFVIDHWLQVEKDWAQIPAFSAVDKDTTGQILEEAGRFAAEVLLPINSPGDVEGCHHDNNGVKTPAGYRAAYHAYVDAGWPSLACAADAGGQELPQLLNAALYEMLMSGCHAWSMYPGLAHGAYESLRAHGSAKLKEEFLPKLVSGEWLATMCLTESHAGSDLGLLRTRAEPDAGGTDEHRYRVTGNKIFISGGEHDLSPNILHLVLARLPDAPVGTKGISLFLVPKLLPTDKGLQANGVHCDRIEKKMGIKGSATCSMNFDGAVGWLIGEPHRGLQAMFVMMNAARLHVALQGLAHSEIAHQNALNYARERIQMRTPQRANASAPADPIIQHPAMRRILLEQRATTQAERMIAYWTAHLMDIAEQHPDATRRAESAQLVTVLTPVVKSMLTENGFAHAASAQQVYGGHGYIHDNGIEQSVRDSRIAMIYEGTTEIQAIDLITRKIIPDRGKAFGALIGFMQEEAAQCVALPACAAFGAKLKQQITILQQSVVTITQDVAQDPERPLRAAVDFQRLLGVVLLAFAWARAVRVDRPHAASADAQERLVSAQFYYDFMLAETTYRQQLIEAACKALPVVS